MDICEYGYTKDKKVNPCLRKALKQARKLISGLIQEMGITPHIVFIARDDDENAVAKYITGTGQNAVIVLYTWQFEGLDGIDLARGLYSTLVHELIHAYLETLGVDSCEFEHDETAVEELTRSWCDGCISTQDLITALEQDADAALNG